MNQHIDERESMFTYVQDLFRRGLVTIVGSGASCAYGLPGMSALASHLVGAVRDGPSLSHEDEDVWRQISDALDFDQGLEEAMAKVEMSEELADVISAAIADVVGTAETAAVAGFLASETPPAFGRLFMHILKTNDIADVITTNYDRLLEISAARAGVRVDTMYCGHTLGRLDEDLSREELLLPRPARSRSAAVELKTRPHMRLAKPHGSLDWYRVQGQHVRSEFRVDGVPQIVAPGGNKYRLGYDIPFDKQRKRANEAIDSATSFLFVGYGFNDDHLQTYLRPVFAQVPVVVVAHSLTSNARDFLSLNPSSIGIEAGPSDDGARLVRAGESIVVDEPIWQLDTLLKEVLGI